MDASSACYASALLDWRKDACGAFREHADQRFTARGPGAPGTKRGLCPRKAARFMRRALLEHARTGGVTVQGTLRLQPARRWGETVGVLELERAVGAVGDAGTASHFWYGAGSLHNP